MPSRQYTVSVWIQSKIADHLGMFFERFGVRCNYLSGRWRGDAKRVQSTYSEPTDWTMLLVLVHLRPTVAHPGHPSQPRKTFGS